tara:strand:+ start:1755 stop:3872 length:2118 start_codon:yes stop_codon:yes gene_type:complete
MKRGELQLANSLANSDIDDDFMSPDDMMDSGTNFNYMLSRKETPAQAALRKAEAGKLAKNLVGMAADMTPFVGGAKAATELPDDLSYAKALVEEGYDEGDIKKMGLGGAFTALSILGLLPGVKIGTDIAKAGIKKSTKEQMEKLITPKRAEQLEYAKTLPAEERRRYLKEVNRPTPKVFHGARNISKKSDNFSSMMKMEEFQYKYMSNAKTLATTNELNLKAAFGNKKEMPLEDLLRSDSSFGAMIPEEIVEYKEGILPTFEPYTADIRFSPRIMDTKSATNEAGFDLIYDKNYVDLIDDTDSIVGEVPLRNGSVNRADLESALERINKDTHSKVKDVYETQKFESKGDQLEKEGFAPYADAGPLSGGSRRTQFMGDDSSFGTARSGQHMELKGIKALSTSRDPLVSMKDAFGNRVLANLVYADLPKVEQRNLSADEYKTLTRRGDPKGTELKEELLDGEGIPLSFPKSTHDEAEIALTKPQELDVKRLSRDDKRISPLKGNPDKPFELDEKSIEKLPTKNTGKLPLAERVAEGQRLVNKIFVQAEKLRKIDITKKSSQEYYSTLRNMFKDAQSLGKYTEQYGARGTYDSFLETVAQNSSFKNSLSEAAKSMPDGEKKRNIIVLNELLESMGFASKDATKRARRATKGMSDKELDSLLFGRRTTTYGIPYTDIDATIKDLGYNDYKRMVFMVTQKLNRGGLMAKK